jgi:hypothetical protein
MFLAWKISSYRGGTASGLAIHHHRTARGPDLGEVEPGQGTTFHLTLEPPGSM